ncbi:unnamed protein product [Amoebophrya sp. A25]|nr:unnamed protein product [Amoebophrya sp. A25]|eukprot:GSA25T00020733001.1
MGAVVSVFGSVAAVLAGCLGSCLGSCLGRIIAAGEIGDGMWRRAFGVLQAWNVMWIFIWRYSASGIFPRNGFLSMWDYGLSSCNREAGTDEILRLACFEQGATDCVFFACFLLFSFLLLLAAVGGTKMALRQFWVAKFLFPAVIPFLLFFLCPRMLYDGWMYYLCVCVSCIYATLQMMLLFDLGYVWNEAWVEKGFDDQRNGIRTGDYSSSSSGRKWFFGILAAAGLFCIIALVAAIALPHVMYPGQVANRTIVWTSFALTLILVCISVTNWCKEGAFLPSAIVFAYFGWLQWLTILQRPGVQLPDRTVTSHHQQGPGSGGFLGGIGFISGSISFTVRGGIDYDDRGNLAMTGDRYAAWVVGSAIMLVALAIFVRNPSLLTITQDASMREKEEAASSSDEENQRHNSSNEDEEDADGTPRRTKLVEKPPRGEAIGFLIVHMASAFYFRTLLYQRQNLAGYVLFAITLYVNIALYGYAILRPQFD